MGKALGLFACGSLITASLWCGHTGQAAEITTGHRKARHDGHAVAAREQSSPALLRLGKEQYAKGHYEAAVKSFRAATFAPGTLTKEERAQLEKYLARAERKLKSLPQRITARGQSPASDNNFAIAAQGATDRKRAVTKWVANARREFERGNIAAAESTARKAAAIDVEFGLLEDSPQRLLEDIAAYKKNAGKNVFATSNAVTRGQGGADSDIQQSGGIPQASRRFPTSTPGDVVQVTGSTTADGAHDEWRIKADSHISKALEAAAAKNYNDAYRHAFAAQQLESKGKVQYGQDETSPSQLIEKLNRMEQSVSGAAQQAVQAKQHAMDLLAAAQRELEAGNFEAAHQKVDEAENMEVAFDLLEMKPGSVRMDIARAETNQPGTFASGGRYQRSNNTGSAFPSTQENNSRFATSNEPRKEDADKLLTEARKLMAQGDLDGARAKAQQAEKIDVAYGLFDDKPDLVMADIARAARTANIASTTPRIPAEEPKHPFDYEPEDPFAGNHDPFAETKPEPAQPTLTADKRQALKLLNQARLDLRKGDAQSAAEKAYMAGQMGVTFGAMDDSPERVLADINYY